MLTSGPQPVAGARVDMQCSYCGPPDPGGANFTSAIGFHIRH